MTSTTHLLERYPCTKEQAGDALFISRCKTEALAKHMGAGLDMANVYVIDEPTGTFVCVDLVGVY